MKIFKIIATACLVISSISAMESQEVFNTALQRGSPAAVKVALAKGANAGEFKAYGLTAAIDTLNELLEVAVMIQNINDVRALLNKGARSAAAYDSAARTLKYAWDDYYNAEDEDELEDASQEIEKAENIATLLKEYMFIQR